jgi:hypothetical protein
MDLNDDVHIYAVGFWRRYLSDAVCRAQQQAEMLARTGDLEGERVWLGVVDAIRELETEVPT